ncbi:MAG: TonB-dependent receptor [Bacteroidetes bacterium]|nr:TonB-dependent receptor [Bacteroidota bacterium]MCL1968263.1 TonB-dependent receptor [Bacteroidota bacterium]
MIKKLLFTLFLCMLFGGAMYAQSTIKGVITDPSGKPIPYLQVLLKQEDKVINGAYTDEGGAYQIFGVPAGTYDITAGGTMVCLTTHTEKGIYVPSSEVKFVNLKIDCSSTELEEVVVEYKPPIFSQDNTTSSTKLTGDEVRKTPGRSISNVLSSMGGVASVDGSVSSVRGARSDAHTTIIDGVRVSGNSGVAWETIEGFELIQGGIPAEFGDATSFTVLTTRGVSKDYHGSIGLRSSLEGYGQMSMDLMLTGPILKGKTPQDPARMGFLIAAEGNYNVDGHPAAGGTWEAKPEAIQEILANPVDIIPEGNGYKSVYNANYLDKDNFQKLRVRKNAQNWGFLAQAKIDIMGGGKDARGRSKNNLRFSLSGSYQYVNALNWGRYAALFNSINNSVTTQSTVRLSARINHRVKTDTAANAILKNIMYDINVNYQLYNSKQEDKIHRNNLFNYGYVGKFTTDRTNFYAIERQNFPIGQGDSMTYDVPTLKIYQGISWVAFDKDGYKFDGNYINPGLVPYTQNFVDFILRETGVDIRNASEEERMIVQQFLARTLDDEQYTFYSGLLNGDAPKSIGNGLFQAPGVGNGSVGKARTATIGGKANLALNIKNHEVKFGVEFEKRTARSYSLGARGLWGLMRGLTYNATAIFALDYGKPYWKSGEKYPIFIDGVIADTLMYEVISTFSNFDMNFRKLKGITDDGILLDIDSYDPSEFSIDLFSNYELFNGGKPNTILISYSGYDYTGKLSKSKINLKEFFSGGDLHNQGKYAIGAYEPVYMAIYLQDKFSISNLLFNLGVRLDYFNANQPVLKDPFLFRSVYTVGELVENGWKIPIDNYGSNWIPYVSIADNDLENAPQTIVAYRDGKTWYNALGQEVVDPASYLGAGGPILREALETGAPSKVSSDAFRKYKPSWNPMPRISFSFPVSTNSLFYAHYDIITYRPPNLQINPIAYLFISEYNTDANIVTNPNLRAQRTIDYEIGFRQAVGENSALGISAYYREQRDNIQAYRYTGAYPNTYYSFENADFGTIQGYIIEFSMRGTKNLSFRANYTLQFAKGTGSTAESNKALIASGQPNLRTLVNLEYDQRHNVAASIDFRYGQGTNYNGPVIRKQKKGAETIKEIRWLENTGAVLFVSAASGMPYSRRELVYSAWGWGQRTSSPLKGTVNGANMPWIITCDLRIDKTFVLNLASKNNTNENGKRKNKPGIFNIYLDFQNLLNLKNVISVYDYTGSPSDDGFLTSTLFDDAISKGEAFNMPVDVARNYYQMMLINPYNYNQPFRVSLGLKFSF